MADYKQMYVLLFNSITDAIKSMDESNYGQARVSLMEAQRKAEGILSKQTSNNLTPPV